MSILSNRRSANNKTIARFGAFNSRYSAVEYVRITNSYFNVSYYQSYSATDMDTVMIKAAIPSGASGYFYGFYTDATHQMHISVSSNTITWQVGGTTRTHAWEAGVHIYGFADGYAVYDGVKVGDIMMASGLSTSTKQGVVIGGRINASNAYECISSIDIYEAVLAVKLNSTSTERRKRHLYAATSNAASTTCYLYDAYAEHSDTSVDSGAYIRAGSGTGTLGSAVTYGVQLHDLKDITGSGYHDLLALCKQVEEAVGFEPTVSY